MRIQKIIVDNGKWQDIAEEEKWLRVVINGRWYDLQERDGALQIRTEDRLTITADFANCIIVKDKQ